MPVFPSLPSVPRGVRRVALGALVVVPALGVSAAHAAPTPSPAPPADAVVLEQRPIAVSASGATVAWLRRTDATGKRAVLVVRDGPGAAPRVIDRALPTAPVDVAVGTDRAGKAVAVVATANTTTFRTRPSSQPVQRGALYVLPLDGSAAPKRLPVSAPGTDLSAPGLLAGRVSFARLQRTGGKQGWTLHSGTLTGRRSTVEARQAAATSLSATTSIRATTPIRGGGLAYTTATPRERGGAGFTFALRVVRANGRTSVVSRTSFGGSAYNETGFGPLTVSPNGARVSAVRGTTGLHTWSVPSGRSVSTVPTGSDNGKSVPAGPEGLAVVGSDGVLRLIPHQG
ncbi:hypothetical protein [Patulibacter americanus]|uniref:hypothetical protein n=1 Tax=Patulibacter americanus TaxID=588672 RepID=UPI00040B55B5|nr:hypothetical protein [Patulibacter americanus]